MIAKRRPRARRGTVLLETAISAMILMIAMTLAAKVTASLAAERRAWDRRGVAAVEVANALERIAAKPFDALAVGPVEGLSLSPTATATLPGAELTADAADDPAGELAARRVTIRLRWRDRAGDWDAPVRLVTWIHRRKEAAR
jgi:Tfp pilus assembly protein PilV